MRVEMFERPVFVEFDDEANQKYCQGTYCCPVCSKDGMIVYTKRAHNDQTKP